MEVLRVFIRKKSWRPLRLGERQEFGWKTRNGIFASVLWLDTGVGTSMIKSDISRPDPETTHAKTKIVSARFYEIPEEVLEQAERVHGGSP